VKRERIVRERYWKNRHFRKMDQDLLGAYKVLNPYRQCMLTAKNRSCKSSETYGETPLTTYEQIAKAVNLGKEDTFLELGCGRGRGCLFLAHFFHCKVIGIDWVESFIAIADALIHDYHMPRLSFVCDDYNTAPWQDPTVIYLFGTTMTEKEIKELIPRLRACDKARIVTVSFPLSDYDESFQIIKTITGAFAWGETEIYINEVRV